MLHAQRLAMDSIRLLVEENTYLRQQLGWVPLTEAQIAVADSMLVSDIAQPESVTGHALAPPSRAP